MRLTQMDSAALGRLTYHLHGRGWMGVRWHGAPRDFALAMTDTLAAALASGASENCLTAAFGAATARTPTASAACQETWGRSVLLHLACALLSESESEVRGASAEALRALANELLVAADQLSPRQSGRTKIGALERTVREARKALLNARGTLAADPTAAVYSITLIDQLSHQLAMFNGKPSQCARLIAQAVQTADLEARHQNDWWTRAAPSVRARVTRQCLVIATEAMLSVAVNPGGATPADRDAELWLSRAATDVLMCAPLTRTWFAEGPTAVTESAAAQAEMIDAAPTEGDAEEAMTETTHPMLKTLKTDATDAAWRTAGSQFIKLAREPLVALLSRHLGPDDESLRARIAAFLETELGTAMLTALLSVGLSSLPSTGSPVPEKLARELRIRSMADTADVVADVLVGPLRQVMAMYLKDVAPTLATSSQATLPEPMGAPMHTTVHSAVDEPARR